jgi:E3 ubiquitin-protein ligase HUWE1
MLHANIFQSPVISDFVKSITTIPLRQLKAELNLLDKLWPFPRGDLYHWIPVLNRFDDILELFTKEYSLDKGPQTCKFGSAILDKGDKAGNELSDNPHKHLPALASDDCDLIETILAFTCMLLENCGNRSLYSSSDRLNDLLNTTSLSLLKSTLQLSLLLAKRYHSSKTRLSSIGGSALLAGHYNISLDRVRRLAASFPTPAPPFRMSATGSVKGKEKGGRPSRASATGAADSKVQGADLAALVRLNVPESDWRPWGEVSMSFYKSHDATKDAFDHEEASPLTPSVRRTSNLAPQTTPIARTSSILAADSTSPSNRLGSGDQSHQSPVQNGSLSVEVNFEQVSKVDSEDLLKLILDEHNVPSDATYELLHKVRTAKAISHSKTTRCDLVTIRLLAVANLAYVDSDSTFQSKISQPDSEQPRRLQLAYQLAELVQPPDGDDGCSPVPVELQTVALSTLEGLAKQKSRSIDVYTALNANVNHGILFYLARKVVTQLGVDEAPEKPRFDTTTGAYIEHNDPGGPDFQEEEWRHALFSLLSSLPTAVPRAGDSMMSAGLLDILIEILSLRTTKAERTHGKVLNFLDSFVYGARDGYQALANAKGLDVIRDLTSFTVTTSLQRAQSGDGMPLGFKAPVIDYQIPFFQQLTLRWLFKFINHLMSHTSANFGRQMRNLIDSAEVLDSLRQVLNNAHIYGSNVWASAVGILTSFIHNEPTSYSVIAESRLGESFLAAITKDSSASADKAEEAVPEEPPANWTPGLLPVGEAIIAVPQAFQALCLNEAGMKLVKDSHALSYFFRIFESPAHVKTMEQDPELPAHLGSAFDELVRHQPTLKPEILLAVQNTVQRVGTLCHSSAAENGYGAKLWDRVDDKLVVAGGGNALKGRQYEALSKTVPSGTDTDMTDDESSDNFMSMEQIHEKQGANHGPHPTAYLAVSARFLAGFLANSAMCTAFIENGGLEYALDFATSPCLPYNFDRISNGSLCEVLGRMFQFLVEQKPFVVLPAILKRMQGALSDLEPLLQHKSPTPFFAPFTKTSNDDAETSTTAITSHGTRYAKALVVVNVLCGVLSGAFSNQMYGPRAQSNIFSMTNLADVYVDVINGLGKLHSSCIWEGCLLVNSIPEEMERETSIVGTGFGTEEVDNVLQIVHAETAGSSSTSAPASTSTTSEPSGLLTQSNGIVKGQVTDSKEIRNTRVVRFLMYQGPHEISQFFQALGKVLLVRRSSDSYQKYNAVKVADQMAASVIEAMQYASQREGDRYKYWIVTFTSLISHLLIDGKFVSTHLLNFKLTLL